jgi:hypothetical protein
VAARTKKVVETEWVKIDPAMATTMLTKNGVNRKIRPRVVECYAEDMLQGLWDETGETIKFSRTGRLLDGQHRLMAIIESGTTLELLVVTGLPDKSQGSMDQGAGRTAMQALGMNDVPNASYCASVARWELLGGEPGPHLEQALKKKASTPRIVKTVEENPDIVVAAGKYASLKSSIPGSPTAICYTWLHLHRVDPTACDEFFFAGLVDMSFKALHDPRKAALCALQRMEREDGIGPSSKDKAFATVSVLTRAWNAWRNDEELDSIPLKKGQKIIPPVKPI